MGLEPFLIVSKALEHFSNDREVWNISECAELFHSFSNISSYSNNEQCA